MLVLKNHQRYYFANNLSEEQIIKIGLTLKGTVRLSSTLSRFLGTTKDDVDDQLQDLIQMGKSIWKSFKNRDRSE